MVETITKESLKIIEMSSIDDDDERVEVIAKAVSYEVFTKCVATRGFTVKEIEITLSYFDLPRVTVWVEDIKHRDRFYNTGPRLCYNMSYFFRSKHYEFIIDIKEF